MRIILGVFLFLLLPSLGWADSSPLWVTPGPEDKSVQYLGYVFGVVNGLLHGTGSQIMGQMFAKFNSGILVLAGFVVFYTTILGLLSSAQEGEFLGKKYSSFFVPLRTALGIILIAPTATGYSWIQVIVMWMVLQGVGAANMVWHSALSYLQNGGAIIVQNQDVTGGTASTVRNNMPGLMQSVTCLQLMQHAIDQVTLSQNAKVSLPTVTALESVTNQFAVTPSTSTSATVQMPNFSTTSDPDWAVLNGKCGSVTFQGADAVAMTQVVADLAAAAPAVTDTCSGGCWPHGRQTVTPGVTPPDPSYCDRGTYLYNGAVSCGQNASCTLMGISASHGGSSTSVPQTAGYGTLYQLFNNLSSSSGPGSGFPLFGWCNAVDTAQPNVTSTFNNAVMDFIGLTYHGSHQWVNQQLPDVNTTSWFSAGTFYFALVAQNEGAQDTSAHSSFSTTAPTVTAVSWLPTTSKLSQFGMEPIFNSWLLPFFASDKNNQLIQSFGDVQMGAKNYGHVDTTDFSISNPGGGGVFEMIVSLLLPGVGQMITSFIAMTQDQANNANPVIIMMMFGSGMLSLAITVWFATAGILGAITMGLGAIPCLTLSNMMQPVTEVVTPFLNIILVPMFAAGCMLLFYLPAVPFMIFTFGAIGWIIGVIEAMVAAPVVGFAIMSPEGNDIFGKGDPAVMIMLNVFLRPSLMIFGLIAGIMVSYIGIWMVNDGYASILKTIAFAGSNFASLLVGLLAVPLVYMVICMQVINRSFTLIHVLPDKVTRWLAGGNVEQLGSEMAGAEKDAKSASQGGMDAGAKGFGDKEGAAAAYKARKAKGKKDTVQSTSES